MYNVAGDRLTSQNGKQNCASWSDDMSQSVTQTLIYSRDTQAIIHTIQPVTLCRVPAPPGKSWIFLSKIPGHGKFWKNIPAFF